MALVFFIRQTIFSLDRINTTQNETNIVDAPISDSASKMATLYWTNKGNQIFHRPPSVSSTVCPVRKQVTWCYYMVLILLHGAIRFFVISCSANIYKPFLN